MTEILALINGRYYYSIIYSPDDVGYYGEIYTREGKTVYTSAVYSTRTDAYNDVVEKGIDLI